MGYWASPSTGKGELYLKTQDATAFPFCVYHYQISLQSGSAYAKTRGEVTVKLVGTLQTISVTFDDGDTTFTRDSVETRVIPLTINIGEVQQVEVDFKKKASLITTLMYSSSWSFTRATVFDGEKQNSRSFCVTDATNSKTRLASC